MSDRPLGVDHPAPWRLIVLAVWDRTVCSAPYQNDVFCMLHTIGMPRAKRFLEFRSLDIIVFLPSLCVFVRHSDDHPRVATYDEYSFWSQRTVPYAEGVDWATIVLSRMAKRRKWRLALTRPKKRVTSGSVGAIDSQNVL